MKRRRKSMALGSMDSHTPSDTLSILPDSIIFRIFSFLDPNQTVRLSSVSKKFLRLCSQSPYLDFSADFDSRRIGLSRYFSDDFGSRNKYTQFCSYINNYMKLRVKSGIAIDRFGFHWFCKQPSLNIGVHLLGSCLKSVTLCSVRELDILICLDWRNKKYLLPHCVNECQSLRVLQLNLQMDEFCLDNKTMDFVEVFLLDSATICDLKFGDKWKSLRQLNLHKVNCKTNIGIESSSLEELKLSNCEIGTVFSNWCMNIASSSLKSLSIFRCKLKSLCRISLDCSSLVNFSVYGSDFNRFSTFKIASQYLDNVEICSSNFEQICCVSISSPSVKLIKINGCKFKNFCHIKMDSLSVDVLNVSDCEIIQPEARNSDICRERRINVLAEKLETLTIKSFDKYSSKFPLSIFAPSLEAIVWKGNPLDFSYLKSLNSIEKGVIDIQPACQHKSKKLTCHCKLLMSSIYCVAMLLQSIKDVKFLEINVWPIELYFMQNDEPIIFKNLVNLSLLVDDLSAEKLPVIAAFLKGLPNLIALVIKCEKKSSLLGDPDLIGLLGLCSRTCSLSLSDDSKQLKIVRGDTQSELEIVGGNAKGVDI